MGIWAYDIWHMAYDIWHMTPVGWTLHRYVTCIKIIDTIIQTNYTNDAYYYVTPVGWTYGHMTPTCVVM
jgi:hypothetical protein